MPGGVPVGTLAIGKAGATNAAVFAASILGLSDGAVGQRLMAWRTSRTNDVLGSRDPRV
jgi:5-(carboxyamino)imidazole ribonucleotide mutase